MSLTLLDWVTRPKNVGLNGVLLIEYERFYLDTFNQSILADARQLKVYKHLMIVFAAELIIFILIFNCQKSSSFKRLKLDSGFLCSTIAIGCNLRSSDTVRLNWLTGHRTLERSKQLPTLVWMIELNISAQGPSDPAGACFESHYLVEKKGHSSELLENDQRLGNCLNW